MVAALNRCAARRCHVDSFSILRFIHDDEFQCNAFSYAPLNLVRVVPSYRCLINENFLVIAVAIGEPIPVLDVK